MDFVEFCGKQIAEITELHNECPCQNLINIASQDLEESRDSHRNESSDLEKEKSKLTQLLANARSEESIIRSACKVLTEQLRSTEETLIEIKRQNNHHEFTKKCLIQRKLRAEAKTNRKDVKFLDTLRKKVKAYLALTGLAWDYLSCNQYKLIGYVRKSCPQRTKVFEINLHNRSKTQATADLWHTIEKIQGL